MKRFLAQALVIARRDFSAIVLTPTFLIFLLAPLFMMSVAAVGGLGAAHVVEGARERAIILADGAQRDRLGDADDRLRGVVGSDPGPPSVEFHAPAANADAQARQFLGEGGVSAIMSGPPERPRVLHAPNGARDAEYLALLAATATGARAELRAFDPATAGPRPRSSNQTAFYAVFAMFFLSLLLASQTISMLAEERNNKVIEILAAAVPLEAVFLGKLIGMLGVALLFSGFWCSIAGVAAASHVAGLSLDAIAPAGNLWSFALLFLGYFMLCFLLLGAVFLGVGAQASTMREIQMLSLPVTIFQVAMFALASAGASAPNSTVGITSAIFPFSSPFAMAGRAASGVPLWQHAAAFAWQLLWLAITVTIAARLFRRGVLKSGGMRR
ncbi:ABC transporter permease [Sphingomonas tabacisoli]|uniref:ABC transporter permease n=1 Tax=Sphingomonas tabacisoli TaxID=2249466 RepID=A0ABW4I1A2_9SPHN